MNSGHGEDAAGRPVSGRWFEQLPVGTQVQHVTRRTVTETDNVLFTTMTMNPAPMHLDAEYAGRSEFGRPLVNSMFTAALVVGLSVPELTLGTIIAQVALSDVQFPAPVFAGDTIRVETEVVEARPSRSRPRTGLVVCTPIRRGVNRAYPPGVAGPLSAAVRSSATCCTRCSGRPRRCRSR